MSLPSLNPKKDAIRLSLLTALALGILKLGVGWVTGSIAVLALAVDSFGDVLSSLFNYFFLSQSQKPADEDHHYGHGKFENFASFIQGLILICSAVFVFYQGLLKLVRHDSVSLAGLGVAVVVVSFIASFIVGQKVKAVGTKENSDLLHVEAQHLLMDSYMYLVVLVSLLFSAYGYHFVDSLGSFIVAGSIIWVSCGIVKNSFDVLTDKSLTETQNDEIRNIINDHHPTILGFDQFKTRKSGPKKEISFRVFICKKITLGKAHDIVDHIETEIQEKIRGAEVLIHPEATMEDCSKHDHSLDPRHFKQESE